MQPVGSAIGRSGDRGFNAAFELVMTPSLFGFLGHLLDVQVGTGRLFMISFVVFVSGYLVWKLVHNYNNEMDILQLDLLDKRRHGLARPQNS